MLLAQPVVNQDRERSHVGHAAGVMNQLIDRDLVVVSRQFRDILARRIAELQFALLREKNDAGACELLGD